MTLEELRDRARVLALRVFEEPRCRQEQETTCLRDWHAKSQEQLQKTGTAIGFQDYDPFSMCLLCRAYWFQEMTAQTLHMAYCLEIKYGAQAKENS